MMTGNAQLSAHELELSKVFNRDFDSQNSRVPTAVLMVAEHARQLL